MRLRTKSILFCCLMVLIPGAKADISSVLTVNGCGSGCGNGPYGTISVQNINQDEVEVTVTLASNEVFASTGAGDPFAFNVDKSVGLASGPTPNPSPSVFSLSGADTFNPLSKATFTDTIVCKTCSGTSNMITGPLVFYLTNSGGLTSSDFVKDSEGDYFGADVGVENAQGKVVGTGDVGTSLITTTMAVTPEPISVSLLLPCFLGMVGFQLRSRSAKS